MAADGAVGVEQVVELFQNQRYRKFKVSIAILQIGRWPSR